jgi:hypothetical protein
MMITPFSLSAPCQVPLGPLEVSVRLQTAMTSAVLFWPYSEEHISIYTKQN